MLRPFTVCCTDFKYVFAINTFLDNREVNRHDDIVYVAMFAQKKNQNQKHERPEDIWNKHVLAEWLLRIQAKSGNK